tara:strand:- start:677 stop:817 length:141 start_codon:yes stop_codon:yes gene_type:complete
MKPIGEIEEDLADKTEPILGFRASSKIKREPIGIVIRRNLDLPFRW